MITKEDLGSLLEQLTEDPKKVFITGEGFKLLSNVITVWRPDLMQKLIILTDEFQALPKLDSPFAFSDARVLKLLRTYSDVIDEITEEIELRKEYFESMQKDDVISDAGTESAPGLEKSKM